jgi:hypothetical protein
LSAGALGLATRTALGFNQNSFLGSDGSELETAATRVSGTDLKLAFHKFDLFSHSSKNTIYFVWGVFIVRGVAEIAEDSN